MMITNNFYLTTYGPLVLTKLGREAAIKHSLPPFIDGSIRREPDLEHAYPAITCLCRTDKFAPRLREGDVVAYMLKKASYGLGYKHQRLTAVLKVIVINETHAEGAAWYREQGLALPNNCMVPGNRANPLSKSHQRVPKQHGCGKTGCSQWDADYKDRAKQWGTFVICKSLWTDLSWQAPEITDDTLVAAFGYVPGTRNPGAQTIASGNRLLKKLGLLIKL